MRKEDSAKFWFPKIQQTWLRTEIPDTVLIDYNEDALAPSFNGQDTAEYNRLYYAVEAAINQGGYPAFIRTDITSAKHVGKDAFTVRCADDLNYALLETLYHASVKTYFSPVKSSAIMVRRLLDLKGDRTAFGGLRIGNEVRVFADQNSVQCWHYYWPQEALVGHMDDGEPPDGHFPVWAAGWLRTDVIQAAEMAAKTMGAGKWSIDFAEDKKEKFWLLDMATAGNSFHDPSCRHAAADEENKL